MTEFEALDWYDAPRYYDIIFDVDTVKEADFLEAAFAKHAQVESARTGLRVLEPACGSGRLVAEFARRGNSVSGFDASAPMLEFARTRLAQQGLGAELFEARMESFGVRKSFDLAHCLVSTFKYVDSEEHAREHLRCIARALRPGGIYALGFHLSVYEYEGFDRERWVAERDGTHVVCNIQGWPADAKTRTERVRSRMAVQEAGRELRLETNWTFRTYNVRQVRALLRAVPELEHVATYDFTYRIDVPRPLDGEQLDILLILRRTASGATRTAPKDRKGAKTGPRPAKKRTRRT